MKDSQKNKKLFFNDKNLIAKEIGKEISRLRRRMKLTGCEVAGYLGISQQQLSRYECGICLIRLDNLLILLHHLEARVEVFFKNVLSNIFEENKDISLQYYNLFFSLDYNVKYPLVK